ncbi:E3 ubiquitin-protein ligase rnf213-alpha-like [Emys orbicularis]|uniref:E3 ubiquitin-protein ligase rnf213-alpha-like n=1 Tax=Emys orbicularis TaxID=82168 RepID=UPI0031FE2137
MKCAECDGKCLEGGTHCPECQQALKGPDGSQSQTEGTKPLELDTNEPNPLSSGWSEDAPAEQDPGPGLQPPADSAEAANEERKVGATDQATGEAETEEQKEGKTPDSRGSGSLEPEINEGNEENEGKPESPGLLKDVLSGQESGPGSQLQAKTEGHEDTSSDSNRAESGRGDDQQLQDNNSWVIIPDSADGEDGDAAGAEMNTQGAEQTAELSCQEWRTSELNQDEAHPLSSGWESRPGSQPQSHAAGVTDELVLSLGQETRIKQFSGHQPESPRNVEIGYLTGSASQPKEMKRKGRKHSDQTQVASKSQTQVPGSAVREGAVQLNMNHYTADREGNKEASASEESILLETYFPNTSCAGKDTMTLEFVVVWSKNVAFDENLNKIVVAAYNGPRRYQEIARMKKRFENNYGLLVVGQATIPVLDLQSRQPIYYKYGVIDIYSGTRAIQLEHIYITTHRNEKAEFHRVLAVPESAIKAGGVWTQFDDICQSRSGSVSIGKSKKTASEFILQFLEDELLKDLSHGKDLGDVERKLDSFKECFKTSSIGDAEQKISDLKTDIDELKVYDYIRKFIENVLGKPRFRHPTISAMDVLLFALCTVVHHNICISAEAMSKIEQMAQNVDSQKDKFMNLKEPRKRKCILALKHVCIQSSKDSKSTCWIWLLPFLYAVQRDPFEPAKDPLTSQDTRSLPFAQLRREEEKQTKVLAMIDAHQTFIGSCAPLAEKVIEMLALKNFCREPVPHIHVPLQLLLSNVYRRITRHLAEGHGINSFQESDVNVVLKDIARRTEAWLGTRHQTGNAEDVLQPKELEDVLQCLNLTLALVTIFLKYPKKIPFSPVMTSLQILELFSETEDLLQTKRDFRVLKQTQRLKEFMNVAESWIQELFPKSSEQEKVFFHYIDMWDQLISAGLFCDEWTRDWRKRIKSLFAEWLKRVNHKHLFDYYLTFINVNKYRDTELENCFSQHIIQSIKGLTKSKKSVLKEILRKFSKTNKPILAQIVSTIIENMWTEELNQIENANRFEKNTADVLIQLLNSSMGLDIISAVQNLKPKVQNQISRDARLLLSKVSELFSFVGRSIFSGDIPFNVLSAILQHMQEFAKMLTLIEPSFSQYIKEVLYVRGNEFEQLKEQTQQRRAFLCLCSCIMDIIKVDVGAMEQSVAIKQSIKDQMLVKKYSIRGKEKSEDLQSHPLAKHDNMVRKVHTLQESQFFRKLWKLKAELAKDVFPDKALLSLDEVQENIYLPAMVDFQTTYLALKDFSISLGDIERQFENIMLTNEKLLREEFKIMEKSEGGPSSKSEWAEAAVVKITSYLKLSTVVKTAKMIDELRKILGLSGDFQLLDDLTKYEDEDFKDKTLGYMTDDIVKVKDTLSNIPESVLDFLKELLECAKKDFISWITTVIKDKTELPTFVELASISAGENDMDIDKVRFFRDAVSASVPILFDLTPESGFEAFSSALSPIRDAVENDNKLPKKLKDSCHNREWLQMVHDCHGSVERSSMSQARAINGNGIFIISTPQKFKPSLDNCISLLLPGDVAEKAAQGDQTDKTDSRTYSLAQLTELQNKLMLIATKAEQGREEVNRFLEILEKIEMVGKLYLQLLSVGNILFIDWKAEVYCDPKRKVTIYAEFGIAGILVQSNKPILEELDGICKIMEHCLVEWKKYLETQRNNYCHLNMFSARQLFYLCSKLAKLHGGQTDPQALNMLSVFKHDVKDEDIREALKRALETPAESVDISEKDDQSVSWNDYIVKFPQLIQGLVESGYDESVGKAALQSYLPNSAITEQMLMEFALDYADEEEKIEELSKLYDEQREAFLQKSMKFKNRNRDVDPSTFQSLAKDEVATSFESLPSIHAKVHLLWNAYCSKLTGLVSDKYISLDVFGEMLKYLTSPETAVIERNLPVGLEAGKPCLVTCKEEQMLLSLLSVYTHSKGAPLPTYDEVLVCTPETEEEDIELIVRRALSPDPRHKKIYCLLGAEKLVYKVSKNLESLFFHFAQSCCNADYRFLIFCDAKAHNSYVMTAFDTYKVSFSCDSGVEIQKYLKTHLRVPSGVAPVAQVFEEPFQQNVKFVFSERAGMGKSLFVANTTRKAKTRPENAGLSHKTIRLTESEIDFGFLLEELRSLEQKPTEAGPRIFHIDISPVVSKGLYKLLIELCILRHIQSPDGMVWKCRESHLYLIEYLVRGKGISSTRKQEMTSEMEKGFLGLLPAVKCMSPIEVLEMLKNNSSGAAAEVEQQLLDSDTFRGDAFQRSYQYISRYQRKANLDSFCFTPGWGEGTQEECLRLLLESCGRKNPSWTELSNFTRFLNLQLMKCENSVFCSSELVKEGFQGFKAFVIKFMITMSKDFALPSLAMADESSPSEEEKMDEDSVLRGYQLRRKWEQESHPYIIFHADNHSMEFLGFHINQNFDAVDAHSPAVLEKKVIDRHLYRTLEFQKVPFNKKFEDLSRQEQLETLCSVFGVRSSQDPDESYQLTLDNTMKMLAIHLRFQCGIPVIVMGETGCGKTKLVQFMCSLQRAGRDVQNMMLVRVHGGTSSKIIHQKVKEAIELARVNEETHNMDTVLFFDEANTTEAVFAIKEVLCDQSVNGEPISTTRLKVVAACNPYKRHTKETIEKLEKAGLGYRVRSEDTLEKLGFIPLRQLVYRVQPLPPSMLPLVWDFGELNEKTQSLYIRQIVKSIVKDKLPEENMDVFTSVISTSQKFLREKKEECRIASLRDIERCMGVLLWFYNLRDLLFPLIDKKKSEAHQSMDYDPSIHAIAKGCEKDQIYALNAAQRSLVLAVGVCYYVSLESRQDYLKEIAKCFSVPESLLQLEIVLCQEVFLDNLSVPKTTARNDALRENIFMMVICMDLRVPLFLVGKPGSSKSLSKTIAADAMQGRLSKTELFKQCKQIQLVSFQCSPHSKPEGIISTFKQCAQFQRGQKLEEFASVVILDEIGLAEDSPEMPLKTLHPLLEDGCVDDEAPEPYKKVGFVGISNWALDPAKMNRGLLVFRTDLNKDELVKTAKGICADEMHVTKIEHLFPSLADFYCDVLKKQSMEFFGLRDFYSLIKMILSYAKKIKSISQEEQYIAKAILRNFGGSKDLNILDLFRKNSPISLPSNLETIHTVHLLQENLDKKQMGFVSRYLLLLTTNHAAFQIIQMTKLMDIENCDIIFGSGFPRDQEYSQVCRSVNRVKICMETGRPVILLNIHNLYESLYDALNQCFVRLGGNYYVDLGLGTHRVKCRVKEEFRLIVIEEKNVVYTQFPTPLLNRLEKHCLEMNTILHWQQKGLTTQLNEWAKLFVTIKNTDFCCTRPADLAPQERDVFIGFSDDTSATVVLQCSPSGFQGISLPDEESVLAASKSKLIECATPDSILRLKYSPLEDAEQVQDLYFGKQKHNGLTDILWGAVNQESNADGTNGLCLEVSTHARLLNQRDLEVVRKRLNLQNKIRCLFLSQFDTEHAFRQELSKFFRESTEEKLLFVQFNFDEPQSSKRLLACAKYCIVDERRKPGTTSPSHVVIITKVPRILGGCNYLAFSAGEWRTVHLDDLLPPKTFAANLGQLSKMTVAEIFMNSTQQRTDTSCPEDSIAPEDAEKANDSPEENLELINTEFLIKQSVQKAVIQLEDKKDNSQRATKRIQILYDALFQSQSKNIFACHFMEVLKRRICNLLQEREMVSHKPREWIFRRALSSEFILEGTSFRHVVWIHLEDILANMFAQILAVIDANNNLDHISQETPVSDLWLQMFKDESFLKIKYTSKAPDAKISVLSMSEDPSRSTQCCFPFSWVLKARLDEIWETVHRVKGYPKDPTVDSAEMFQSSILNMPVPDGNSPEMVQRYASDFVRMAFPGQDAQVYEILSNVLITGAKRLCTSLAQDEVGFSLIWLHIEYFYLQENYQLFINLVKNEETLANELQKVYKEDTTKMFVALDAVSIILKQLQPTEKVLLPFNACLSWLKRIKSIKHTVELITSDDYQMRLYDNKEELLNSVLHQWNCTNIVYLLIDHLLHDETNVDEKLLKLVVKQFVFLWNLLYKIEDHKPAKIFEVVTKVLKRCSNNAATVYLVKGVKECKSCQNEITDPAELPCGHIFCTQCIREWNIRQCKICKESFPEDYVPTASQITREAVASHNKFRRKCNSFFVEFVSSYCFGDKIPPSAEIIEQLIKFVACKPSNSEHQEIRKVYKPTSDLSPFEECMDPSPTVKSSLLKMLLRCRLDNVKEHLEGYLSRMEEVLALNQSSRNDFYFMVVCCFEDFMYSSFQEDASQNSEHVLSTADLSAPSSATVTSIENLQFIAKLRLAIGNVAAVLGRELPSAADQNTWTSAETAEKQSQLVNSMKTLVEKAQTPWPQIFLIRNLCNFYGLNIMQKILQQESWILPREIETSQDMKISSNTPLMLVTLDRARGLIKNTDSEEAKQITAITKHMERLLQASRPSEESMENKLEKIMSDVSSQENAALLEVVLHTALTLTLSQHPLTELFKSICFQPSAVKVSYLPTMPSDLLFDVTNWKNTATADTLWRCQCGQYWRIENCGRPWVIIKCLCDSEVGGTNHNPVEGFEEVDITKDKTERGYVLGSPSSRNNETERDLPATSVCIARALLHSSMLLGTFTDRQSILELMKVKPQDAVKFFCDHLEKDIQFLAESLSGNIDDATMTVHLFLGYILDSTADTNMTIKCMHEKADRVQWESCLKAVTQSFFQVLEQKLASAKQQIVEEGAHSSNVLLKVAYGQSPPFSHLPSCGPINMPCMWRFEQRMTVQRLTHLVQQENGANQFPVLLELLSKHQHIRHIRHLPEILALQRSLIHFFQNGNIHEGESLSVRNFLERDDLSDDQCLTFERAIQTVQKVWSNIRSSPRSSEISIPEELWCKEISADTAILDLLPTTPSITSIVTRFLIQLQNSCFDTAAKLTKEKQRSVSAEEVKHASVLSVTESDLITMALSNFQYALEEDGTKTTHYNFLTLQRQVIHRFISGKPFVKAQTIPSIALNNVKTLHSTKANVREQLHQEPLSVSLMKRIMEEASSVSDISRALSTLKVAAEFLAVTGGDPERLLTEYVRNELKMEANAKQFRDLPVVPQTQLKHILSLWQILSAKRSALLVQMNQNPFFLIDKGYHDELADQEREELTTALSTVNIEFFIIELHEMITVALESCKNSWGIVETFQEYLEKEGKEENYIVNLTSAVSPDLQLKNVISVWKTAVLINKTYARSYIQA